MIMRRIAVIAVLAVVATACGGGDDAASGDAQEQTTSAPGSTSDAVTASAGEDAIEVVLSEFAFEPGSFEVAPGETVTFLVTNTGVVEHELRLSNAARIEEHLEAGHADDDHDGVVGEEAEADEEAEDVLVLLEPGETGELTFTAPEDRSLYTEVVCLVPGHYEAGMKAPLTISG